MTTVMNQPGPLRDVLPAPIFNQFQACPSIGFMLRKNKQRLCREVVS
jgi:hypothetical protein